MMRSSPLLRSPSVFAWPVAWLAIGLAGCSSALSGPDPELAIGVVPRCDSGKSLIVLDAIFGTLLTVTGTGALLDGDGAAALIPMGIGATYLLSALTANTRVNRCRRAIDDVNEELSVARKLLQPEQEAPEPAASSAPSAPGAPSAASAPSASGTIANATEVASAASKPAKAETPSSPAEVLALARRYVIDGLAAHRAGLFDDAIALYRRAYDLAPRPELLFNLAQVYRLKGELPAALDFYRKYLAIDETSELAIEASAWASWLEGRLSAPAPSRASRSDGLPAPGVP